MNAVAQLSEPRAVRFDPDALAFEAFSLGRDDKDWTSLYEPLRATSLKDALAEATARWSWNRGDRLGIRELGGGKDLLRVYAVRQQSHGHRVWNGHISSTEYRRWLDHICTIDLNVVAGIPVGAVGCEIDLHLRRQHQRPEGARLERGER